MIEILRVIGARFAGDPRSAQRKAAPSSSAIANGQSQISKQKTQKLALRYRLSDVIAYEFGRDRV
jgi:hypothetical protein